MPYGDKSLRVGLSHIGQSRKVGIAVEFLFGKHVASWVLACVFLSPNFACALVMCGMVYLLDLAASPCAGGRRGGGNQFFKTGFAGSTRFVSFHFNRRLEAPCVLRPPRSLWHGAGATMGCITRCPPAWSYRGLEKHARRLSLPRTCFAAPCAFRQHAAVSSTRAECSLVQ